MIQVTFQRHVETPWEEGSHQEANHDAAYFGTYSVDYEAMTVTHNFEGAKSPNRIGRVAMRSFRFEDGDLVPDFKTPNGRRFYRRLQPVESFQSDD